MKKYTVKKIAVIGGKTPKIDSVIELDENAKSTKAYLKAGFIKESKEVVLKDDTAPLTADAIEAMSYQERKAKVAELGLDVENQQDATLKAALLASLEVEDKEDGEE